MISGISALSVAIAAVALRFYVRLRITKRCGADDWALLVALMLFAVNQALIILGETAFAIPDPQDRALPIGGVGALEPYFIVCSPTWTFRFR